MPRAFFSAGQSPTGTGAGMTDSSPGMPEPNPFTTRHVRPDVMPYLFPLHGDAARYIKQLSTQDWNGQIVGPHGSGKSTLIRSLIPPLEHAGREVAFYELHAGERRLHGPAPRTWGKNSQVIIDGYEQLPRWRRAWIRWTCRVRKAGLLVTAHRDVGLPTLAALEVSPATFESVVTYLLKDTTVALSRDDLQACFMQHAPNMREMLFALHDLVETQSRRQGRA